MKNIFIGLLIVASVAVQANAASWLVGGIWYGNVCRNGAYFTVYPPAFGLPVGAQCLIRDNWGNPIMYGTVSGE